MDYKFTFEDGSEYLAHYGKVGMKWRKGRKTPIRTPGTGMIQRGMNDLTPTGHSDSANRVATQKNMSRRLTNILNAKKPSRNGSKGPKGLTGIIEKARDDERKKKIEQRKKKFGNMKRQKTYNSKAGLTAKYARKVSSANSQYSSIKSQHRQDRLSGYKGLTPRG